MTHNDDCQYCKSLAEEIAEKYNLKHYSPAQEKSVPNRDIVAAIDEAIERCAQIVEGDRDRSDWQESVSYEFHNRELTATIRALKSTP